MKKKVGKTTKKTKRVRAKKTGKGGLGEINSLLSKNKAWITEKVVSAHKRRIKTWHGASILVLLLMFTLITFWAMNEKICLQNSFLDSSGTNLVLTKSKQARGEEMRKGRVLGSSKDHVLVKFKDGVKNEKKEKFFLKNKTKEKFEIKQIGVKAILVPEGKTPKGLVEKIKKEDSEIIDFAEEDSFLEPTFIPNDPLYPNQWHHPKINSPLAWEKSNGSSVIIAIADTGVDCNHPDLALNCVSGWNTVSNNNDTTDVCGHGTSVAGTAAAVGNNGVQVAGVSYASKIMPLRVSNDSSGYAYFSDIAEAIVWAADHGARVANASYMASGSYSVQSAADYMKKKGGLVTISAGNSGADTGLGSISQIITVSATTSSDTRASFSSFGNNIDVSAPGVGILSTTRGGGTGSVSGTSFSAPTTAGVIGLIFSANPELSADQAQDILFKSSKDLGTTGWDIYYGWGRVDAEAAVNLAASGVTPTPEPEPETDTTNPQVSFIEPANGATVSDVVSLSVSASDNVGVSNVKFYLNGDLLGEDSSSPYTYNWDSTNYSGSSANLSAVAYDIAGNKAEDSITVTVSNYSDEINPTVVISSPTDGTVLPSKGRVSVLAKASDDSGRISKIEIFIDNKIKTTCSNSDSCSYNLNVSSLKKGTHSIFAKAYDMAGNVGSSDPVSVIK